MRKRCRISATPAVEAGSGGRAPAAGNRAAVSSYPHGSGLCQRSTVLVHEGRDRRPSLIYRGGHVNRASRFATTVLLALLAAVVPLDLRLHASGRRGSGCRSRTGGERHAEGGVREVHAAERPAGHPARRSQAADRAREPVVPRRVEEREARPHRLRAPVRAHDVPGLEERRGRVLHLRRAGRRQRLRGRRQRHDQPGPHQLLRDGAVGEPRERPVVRVGSAADADRRHDQGEARQPARRREERAAPGAREPAVRPLVPAHHRRRCSRRGTRTRGR